MKRKQETTDWFLELPDEITNAIAANTKKANVVVRLVLKSFPSFSLFSLSFLALIGLIPLVPSYPPEWFGIILAVIFPASAFLIAVLMNQFLMSVLIRSLPPHPKAALFSANSGLTERDIEIALERHISIKKESHTELADKYINDRVSEAMFGQFRNMSIVTLLIALAFTSIPSAG